MLVAMGSLVMLTLLGDPELMAEAPAPAPHAAFDFDPTEIPDHQYRRPSGRRGRYRPKYQQRERLLGGQLFVGVVSPEGKVARSFSPGPRLGARFAINLDDANGMSIGFRYSYHRLRDPRRIFFRSADTDISTSSGALQIISPEFTYSYTVPFGYNFNSRARFLPRAFFGVVPNITLAKATLTDAGTKGDVSGSGSQLFMGFPFGVIFDVRVADFVFIGLQSSYEFTFPINRPPLDQEFTIPRLWMWDICATAAWHFF